MSPRPRGPRGLAAVLLAVCIVVSHLPLPAALASSPGPGVLTECSGDSARGVTPADPCCQPAPRGPTVTPSRCCDPVARDDAPGGDTDPCCPDGCKHCPRSCCSAPLAMAARGDVHRPVLPSAPQAEHPLGALDSVAPTSIFHPPRG